MFIKQFATGGDRNFGYLAADEKSKEAMIIDPSYSPEIICRFASDNEFKVKYIFNTHDHHDHTNGNDIAREMTGIEPMTLGAVEPLTGTVIKDKAKLYLGNSEILILHTPGHTEDSICLYFGDALFTGDTLFVGKVGGTGFGDDAKEEYHSLHNKLMTLPKETKIYPGHDVGVAPHSTIENELKTNPFLIQPDLESFINLKKNWLEYKKQHGIE